MHWDSTRSRHVTSANDENRSPTPPKIPNAIAPGHPKLTSFHHSNYPDGEPPERYYWRLLFFFLFLSRSGLPCTLTKSTLNPFATRKSWTRGALVHSLHVSISMVQFRALWEFRTGNSPSS